MIASLALLSATVSFVVAYVLIRNADKLSLLDVPNARSSHQTSTPRGGGAGIFLAGTAMGAYLAWSHAWPLGGYVLALASIVAITGFLDDVYSLSARSRLLVQFFCCSLLYISAVPSALPVSPIGWIMLAMLLVLGVWWINLFNFMDGIDAIAATQGIFMLGAAAAISVLNAPEARFDPAWQWMLLLAAGVMGFLLLNWPPARIFMGDVGSTYLAFMVLALAIMSVSNGWLRGSTWAILGAVFFADATITLLTRMARGQRWHEAHRSHAYQRLARRWNSHRSVVALTITFNLLWALPLGLSTMAWVKYEYLFVLITYSPLVMGVMLLGGGKPDAA